MKTTFTTSLFLTLALCAWSADWTRMGFVPNSPSPATAPPHKLTPWEISLSNERCMHMARDPYRLIRGQVNSVLAKGFVTFSGKVIGVEKGGIRVWGWFEYFGNSAPIQPEKEFFVSAFPYQVADDEAIGLDINQILMAKLAGLHKYSSAIGGTRTIRLLEYGTPCAPPALRVVIAASSQKPRGMSIFASTNAAPKMDNTNAVAQKH